MMTTLSRSQTLAFGPKCCLKTPMVPGPHTSWVMSTSVLTQMLSAGATAARPAWRAKTFSVNVSALISFGSARGGYVPMIADQPRCGHGGKRQAAAGAAGICNAHHSCTQTAPLTLSSAGARVARAGFTATLVNNVRCVERACGVHYRRPAIAPPSDYRQPACGTYE